MVQIGQLVDKVEIVDETVSGKVTMQHDVADGYPHGRFREMRESGFPVAHSDHYEGFWALVDYSLVFEAARDDALFNSFPSIAVPSSELPLPILPIESDPPETQKLRAVTPETVLARAGAAVP